MVPVKKNPFFREMPCIAVPLLLAMYRYVYSTYCIMPQKASSAYQQTAPLSTRKQDFAQDLSTLLYVLLLFHRAQECNKTKISLVHLPARCTCLRQSLPLADDEVLGAAPINKVAEQSPQKIVRRSDFFSRLRGLLTGLCSLNSGLFRKRRRKVVLVGRLMPGEGVHFHSWNYELKNGD